MSASRLDADLQPRDREILRDVIRTYLLTGFPVSSRTLARHEQHGVSAATIRNILADLEDRGFLEQPHQSAGRVPSTSGLRFYLESLMETQELSLTERREIESGLHQAGASPESVAGSAVRLLSRYSGRVGILAIPNLADTVLETVSFVPLSGRRVLCVLVSKAGFIENRLFETTEPMAFEELVRLSNYLTESYRGKTLRAIRDQLRASLDEQRDEVFCLLGRQIQLAELGLASASPPEMIVEGTSQVLGQGSLTALDQVRRLLDTFAERSRLLGLLSQCVEGGGVRVVFGEDSSLTSELGLSLVARPFGADGPGRGALGILGPTCMPYERIIPLVDFLGDTLSRILMEGLER